MRNGGRETKTNAGTNVGTNEETRRWTLREKQGKKKLPKLKAASFETPPTICPTETLLLLPMPGQKTVRKDQYLHQEQVNQISVSIFSALLLLSRCATPNLVGCLVSRLPCTPPLLAPASLFTCSFHSQSSSRGELRPVTTHSRPHRTARGTAIHKT